MVLGEGGERVVVIYVSQRVSYRPTSKVPVGTLHGHTKTLFLSSGYRCLTEWSHWDIHSVMINFFRLTHGVAYTQACFRTCHHARRGCTIPLLELHSYLHVEGPGSLRSRGRMDISARNAKEALRGDSE